MESKQPLIGMPESDISKISEFSVYYQRYRIATERSSQLDKMIINLRDAADEAMVAGMEFDNPPLYYDFLNDDPPMIWMKVEGDQLSNMIAQKLEELTSEKSKCDEEIAELRKRMIANRTYIYSKYNSEAIKMDFETEEEK